MREPVERTRFAHDGLVALELRHPGTGPGPEGAVFVLVHGIGVGRSYFSRLAPLLAEHGSVHVLELPGFGATPKPSHVLTVEEHGAVLAAYLEAIGRPAVLVGHSMGTQVVLDAAARGPALVERLVLIGVVTDPEERSAWAQGLRLLQDTLGETPATNLAVFSEYALCGPRRYLATLPSMLQYDTEGVAALVPVPTLVLRGALDPICRRPWARRVTRALRTGRLVEVPGGHHNVQHTHPRAVASAILTAGPHR